MPQPLRRVKKVSGITWGAVLPARPQLASLILDCITIWSQTEIRLGTLLAVILRAEHGFAAVQMYLRLTSADARRSVLDAAAKSMLSNDDYNLFSLTMKALKPVRDRRNDFAHGLWGTAAELPDALLWVASDDYLAYGAVWLGASPKNQNGPGMLSPMFEAHEDHLDAIQVYRKSDLDSDTERANEASLAAFHLTQALNSSFAGRDAIRQMLCQMRLIQAVLRPESASEDKPSPPPQQPPETPDETK
jgi:hypothetical protein